MSNSHDRSKRHFPRHHSIHGNPTRFPDRNVPKKIGNQTVHIPETHSVKAQSRVIVQCQPSTSTSSDLLNNGQVDFRIEKGLIDLIDHCYLKIQITNDTGLGSDLVPAALWINRIEIFSGNGSTLLSQIYGQELWLSNVFLSQEEWLNLNTYMGSTDTYSPAGITLANGGTLSRYILLSQLVSAANLSISGLGSELLIRVYFNPTARSHTAGSLVNCDSATLLLKGKNEMSELTKQRNDVYKNSISVVPFQQFQRMSQSLTLAASTEYSILLSGIMGLVGSAIFTVRDAAITGANQASYDTNIDSFDIQHADGSSMLGYYRRSRDEMIMDLGELLPNEFVSNSGFNMICFGDDPVQDYTTGSNSGYQVFTGHEKLSFSTSVGLTPGAFVIDVYCLVFEHLTIKNGQINVSRS